MLILQTEDDEDDQQQMERTDELAEAGRAAGRQCGNTARILVGGQVDDGSLATGERIVTGGPVGHQRRDRMADAERLQVPAFQPVAHPAVVARARPLVAFQQQTA